MFSVVIARKPQSASGEPTTDWGAFTVLAKIEALQNTPGVFSISEAAWIFDTRKALAELGRVIHLADEKKIQLFLFPLPAGSVPNGVSAPPLSELEQFLCT